MKNLQEKYFSLGGGSMSRDTRISNKPIYLDNAATTQPYPEVIFEANKVTQKYWYNPSSLYDKATEIKEKMERARKNIGYCIGAKDNEICFTSGGSESNCFAIQGFIGHWIAKDRHPIIITTTVEHKSIIECVCKLDVDTHFLGVNSTGNIDMLQLELLLERSTRDYPNSAVLVSIQYANNETGIMQPIQQMAQMVHKYGAFFHTDAVQAVGNIPVDVKMLDVDMLSASGHKFHSIKGTGLLYIKQGIGIAPLIYGTQNNRLRGGTENVAGIISMERALRMCDISSNMINAKFAMRDKFMDALKQLPYNIEFNNRTAYTNTLPTIISGTIREKITAEALVYMLNAANIYISAGSACNAHSHKPSHVLHAMGMKYEDAIRTIRISFGADITDEDVDIFVSELGKAIKILNMR